MKAAAASIPGRNDPPRARHTGRPAAGPAFARWRAFLRARGCPSSRALIATLSLLVGAVVPSRAAVLSTETFGSGSSGWVDRDPVEMTVSYNAGFGNTAGSLQGSFASQGSPAFESDAFRATAASSGGAFSGDFYTTYPTFSAITFDFLAMDILPSTLIFRIGDGVNTFLYNVNPQLNALATWNNISVSLAYSGNWLGGSAAQFSNVFNNVTFMDVQVARNGTGAQDYFVDNFTLHGGTQPGGESVPEPNSIGLLLVGVGTMFRLRRHLPGRRLNLWHEGR